jgi:catechol 2,3-dioxygenase-like lactoylglutathione lyase family enzyme
MIRRVVVLAAAVAVIFTLQAPVLAAPVPDSERVPVDIRRTTLVVRDIDKSLPLYRDALGLKVIYDELIGGGVDARGKSSPPTTRLVLLRANDTFVGVLGLMQRLNIPPSPDPTFAKAMPGQPIIVMNVADLEQRFAVVEKTPFVKVETLPRRIEYPAAGGQGKIPVLFSAVWDADGNYIELNKLLGEPAGAPTKRP